jgi:hypothetical protein
MLMHAANARLERVGQQPIIGIKKNEELTATLLQSSVSSVRTAGIFLVHVPNWRIALNDFRGVIG